MRKTAFIGHRQIFANTLNKRLVAAITNEIKSGCLNFTMGTHGDFDRLALSTCRTLRNLYHDISIEVAITSLNSKPPMRVPIVSTISQTLILLYLILKKHTIKDE